MLLMHWTRDAEDRLTAAWPDAACENCENENCENELGRRAQGGGA